MPDRKPCPPDHSHGAAVTCYKIHHCSCIPCRDAATAAARTRRRAKAFGRWEPLVDAQPVRDHVRDLMGRGLGITAIAQVSGVPSATINQLINGRRTHPADPAYRQPLRHMHRATADRLLAAEPGPDFYQPHARMSALGTHRRIQALVYNGWTMSKLAARLGRSTSNFQHVMKARQVSVRLHREVCALFADLWDKQPAHETHRELIVFNRSRNYARTNGWLPALAWDDIDTDPAPATVAAHYYGDVDEIAIELAIAGTPQQLTSEELRAIIPRLHAKLLSDNEIAALAGCNARTVLRIRQELDLESTYERARAAA